MSVLPRIALFLQYALPRNSRNTQNLLVVYSPTDCTEYTEPSCCMFSHGMHGIHRTFLLYVLPRIAQIFTEPSCCIFSHGIHGVHRTFLLYVLPRIARIFIDAAFKGVHLSPLGFAACQSKKCTNPFCCCTSCSVGALETSAPP